MEIENGVTAQQIMWSSNMQIEIVHKGQQTQPFAGTSHHLPYAIWTTILKINSTVNFRMDFQMANSKSKSSRQY